MCTGLNFKTKDNNYFGRNYDYELSYKETVTVVPRNFNLHYREFDDIDAHHAMIGITTGFVDEYPLFYDAMNEKGLCVAGLNFQDNAVYNQVEKDMINITPFEFIPFLLGSFESVTDVKKILGDVNLIDEDYSKELPLSPLHWIIGDKTGDCIVVESVKEGLKVYDNPYGVLTNNPPFNYQINELNKYMGLSTVNPSNNFGVELNEYSRGMGAFGLPGDYSSTSRFVKAVYTLANAKEYDYDEGNINQFFHILGSVEQVNGLTKVNNQGDYEYTIYSSCYAKDTLFYKTYNDFCINSVCLNDFALDSVELYHQEL